MTTNNQHSRRGFLRRTVWGAAAVAAGSAAAPRAWRVNGVLHAASRGDKVRTAIVGCGSRGRTTHVSACAQEVVVALVDPLAKSFNECFKAAKKVDENFDASKVRTFDDYRTMFDQMRGQIDAVSVATPNHHHAPPALMAMREGMAAFVEKPLCYDLWEARELARLAAEKKVATQMGNQGHCGEGYRRLCEAVWAGAIGNVTQAFHWSDRHNGGVGPRPPTIAPPAGMNWDVWIGPSPYRDYHDDLHPHGWHGWYDFGNGSIGNMGCHMIDGSHWALKLGHASSVECEAVVGGTDERYPVGSRIRWEFPARQDMPPVTVWWYDGYRSEADMANTGAGGHDQYSVALEAQNLPPIVRELSKKYDRKFDSNGSLFIGDKGMLYTGLYGGGISFVPDRPDFTWPEKSIPRIKGTPHTDFFDGIRMGQTPCSHFGMAAGLSEMILLGCLATKAGVGRRLEWDGPGMKFTNAPELNRLIRRQPRQGWQV